MSSFHKNINMLDSRDEEGVVLESYFEEERVDMASHVDSKVQFLYMHFLVIYDLGGTNSFHSV